MDDMISDILRLQSIAVAQGGTVDRSRWQYNIIRAQRLKYTWRSADRRDALWDDASRPVNISIMVARSRACDRRCNAASINTARRSNAYRLLARVALHKYNITAHFNHAYHWRSMKVISPRYIGMPLWYISIAQKSRVWRMRDLF